MTSTQGGAVAKTLAKGSRISGAQRTTLASQYAKRYASGESIRKIADDAGRSYGFVHNVLKESGVSLRGRGGATPGTPQKAPARASKGAGGKDGGQEGDRQEGDRQEGCGQGGAGQEARQDSGSPDDGHE